MATLNTATLKVGGLEVLMVYIGTQSVYSTAPISLSTVTDTQITNPQDGDELVFISGYWSNVA
jgi:hypothetical protein